MEENLSIYSGSVLIMVPKVPFYCGPNSDHPGHLLKRLEYTQSSCRSTHCCLSCAVENRTNLSSWMPRFAGSAHRSKSRYRLRTRLYEGGPRKAASFDAEAGYAFGRLNQLLGRFDDHDHDHHPHTEVQGRVIHLAGWQAPF